MGLEVTTKIGCVCMCEYCPQTLLVKRFLDRDLEKRKPKKEDLLFSLENFKKCIETVPLNIPIHFTGYSEPFDNPNAHELIIHAHNKGHKVLVNTTLMGLTKEKFDMIKHIPFTMFNIHCPSATFKENIGVAKPPKYLPSGQRELSKEWMELLIYIADHQLPSQNMHCHGGLHPQVKELLPEELREAYALGITRGVNDRAQAFLEQDDVTNEIIKTKVPPEQNIRGKCNRIYQPVLLPDGRLALCCQDYGLKHTPGNLLKQTWQEYRSSEVFLDIESNGADLCDFCVRGGPSADAGEFKKALQEAKAGLI